MQEGSKTIDFVLGTRPELLKLVSVVGALDRRCPGAARLVDTQQQVALKEPLFDEYDLRSVERVVLGRGDSSLAAQLATQVDQLGQHFAAGGTRGVVCKGTPPPRLPGHWRVSMPACPSCMSRLVCVHMIGVSLFRRRCIGA